MVRLSASDLLAMYRAGRRPTLADKLRHCSDRGQIEGFVAAVKARGEWTTDIAELAKDMWRSVRDR